MVLCVATACRYPPATKQTLLGSGVIMYLLISPMTDRSPKSSLDRSSYCAGWPVSVPAGSAPQCDNTHIFDGRRLITRDSSTRVLATSVAGGPRILLPGAALVSPPGPRLGAAAMSWKHDAPPNGLRRLPGAECANRLHAQFLGGTTGACYFRRGAGAIRRHRGVRGRAGCNGGSAAAASTVTMSVAA